MIKTIVVGMGEVGSPLYSILKEAYPDAQYCDDNETSRIMATDTCEVLNICFGYSSKFVDEVLRYQDRYKPALTIIHSTVPIGTTAKIPDAVHSPVLGDHTNMRESLLKFTKWIGGTNLADARNFLNKAGFKCCLLDKPEHTEAFKLMCLATYGASIALAQYRKEVCDSVGASYDIMLEWDKKYNAEVAEHLRRPILIPPGKTIGGHCITQNTKLLAKQHPNRILDEILKFDGNKDYKVWEPCNIYPTAKIGKDVSIGAFCEIGNNVVIGEKTRIGGGSFIPEGVTIEEDVFIGPHTVFANDRYPPSGKENWEKTVVKKGARIGAGVKILPGVTIGEGALVGMGAVVNKNIPAGETWMGVPAKMKIVK